MYTVNSHYSYPLKCDHLPQNEQLWWASRDGDNERVGQLLDEGADINYEQSLGVTVLGYAAHGGHTDTVRLLISKQELDINKRSSLNRRNALHWSCVRGHIDCARLLINAGIDLQATDENGNDAVLCACKSGNLQLVEFLINQGQFFSSVNKNGNDAVLYACESGNLQLVEFLFNQGQSLSSVNDNGDDAVLNACWSGNLQLVEFLFSQGQSLSSINKDGNDAVLNACWTGNVQLVDFLIKQGHSLSSVNNNCQNVMHKACQRNRIDMIKYLMTKGYSLDSPEDKYGKTPRMRLYQNNEDIKRFLEELNSQDNTENPTVSTESTDTNTESTDKDSQQDTHLDYAPYLEKAAAKGTVITRQSSLGLCGAAGTGKSSTLRLITGQPPLEQHTSTPMLKPEEYYVKQELHISNEGKLEKATEKEISDETVWKLATEKEIRERLVNWTLAAIEKEKTVYKGKEYNTVVAFTRPDEGNQDSTPNDNLIEEMSDGVTPREVLPEQTFVERTYNKMSESILKLMESVKTLNKPLGITHFISTCDTGGQAAFIDIAPAFLRYNSVILILLKLDENLDDPAQFFYSVNGVRVGNEERQISTRSLIHSFVSSKSKIRKPNIKGMKVVRQSAQKPKFMILGTHFDKYKEKLGKFQSKEEKNEILSQDLEAFNDCLHPKSLSELIFTVNTLARDENSKCLAKKIRTLVMDNYIEAEIPIAWYMFQLAMYEFKSLKADQGMIHLSTLIEIGTVTKMPQKEVEACLLYFHDLQVCLYFPSVVPNIVFTNPQFLFDKISELIAFTFSKSTNIKINKKELEKFINCGVFTEAFLKYVCSGFKDDFFSAKDFLSLMSHLFVVCSLPNTDEYFMPCVLATHPNPCEDLSMCSGKPLALTWDKSVPNGLFPSLTTKIQSGNDVNNNLNFTMSKVEQYRNRITLYSDNLGCKVTLIECTSFIAFLLNTCGTQVALDSYVKVRAVVLRCINDIVNRLEWVQAEPKECFICDICPPSSECPVHLCCFNEARTMLSCRKAERTTDVTPSHLLWWNHEGGLQHDGKSPANTSSPPVCDSHTSQQVDNQILVTVADVLGESPKVEHMQHVLKDYAADYDRIGTILGLTYNARRTIDTDHVQYLGHEKKLNAMINQCLEKYPNKTWREFIEAFRKDEMNKLADLIEEYLESKEIQEYYASNKK